MGAFWHQVLGVDYQRLAKTTAEEGIELMAYSIWLSASLEYWVNARWVEPTGSRIPTRHRSGGYHEGNDPLKGIGRKHAHLPQ